LQKVRFNVNTCTHDPVMTPARGNGEDLNVPAVVSVKNKRYA
jgi:hypothetical protein